MSYITEVPKWIPVEELVKRLIEESKCPDNYSEDSVLMIEAANAIDALNKQNEKWEEALKTAIDFIPCWIPVTERLPSPEVEVLVYTNDKRIGIDKFFGIILDRPTFSKKGMNRVTYWMPLPEPPKEEKLDVQGEI